LDSIISEICYLYICVFKYFSDISGFLPNISKYNPFGGISICEFLVWFYLDFGIYHIWTGKELLFSMLWMGLFFPLYSSLCNLYVCCLLYSYLTATYLC